MITRWLAAIATLIVFAWASSSHARETVTIFAAASTQPALEALRPVLSERGIELRTVYAGTSALVRQITHGAPADVFISANIHWTDYLMDQGKVAPGSRRIIAYNRLVLITSPRPFAAPEMAFGEGYPLDQVLGEERLAIADPGHVPAGIYAREALTSLRMWNKIKDKLAHTQDVTGALLMVDRGEARMGIVYATDVRRSPRIGVLATFPAHTHSPITYFAMRITGRNSQVAQTVLEFLSGPEGRKAFTAAGFGEAP